MGREVCIGIYDKLKNSYTFKEDGWYICGRNSFTNDLYSLFLNRDTQFLIVDVFNDLPESEIKGCIDEDKKLEKSNAYTIKTEQIDNIVQEHKKEVQKERDVLNSRIESLHTVRNNVRTLQDWLDVDTFIQELSNDLENLKYASSEEFDSILHDACNMCVDLNIQHRADLSLLKLNSLSLEDPMNPLRNNGRNRYYPIVLFSD